MDLLKQMLATRQQMGVVNDPKPRRAKSAKKETKADRAKENVPGSRAMRKFIIDETPSKKIVKEHLEAIIARECESSDED
jgi:hypothetical protein